MVWQKKLKVRLFSNYKYLKSGTVTLLIISIVVFVIGSMSVFSAMFNGGDVMLFFVVMLNLIKLLLGGAALIGVGYSAYKIFRPKVKISIMSYYPTLGSDDELLCVIKIRTEASVELVIEDLAVSVCPLTDENAERFVDLEHYRLRKKGFIPVMQDIHGNDCHYRLLKPIEPQLQDQTMKSGVNSYYLALRSHEKFDGTDVKSWLFSITVRPTLLFVPEKWSRRTLAIEVEQPPVKDRYFDDDFVQKITKEEADRIIKEEL